MLNRCCAVGSTRKDKEHRTEYQKQSHRRNREKINVYMRNYVRQYRNKKSVTIKKHLIDWK
jgi:hypothetical protein